ncbi:hypothetical protein JZ751_026082, partial [Albula glossodonta]
MTVHALRPVLHLEGVWVSLHGKEPWGVSVTKVYPGGQRHPKPEEEESSMVMAKVSVETNTPSTLCSRTASVMIRSLK